MPLFETAGDAIDAVSADLRAGFDGVFEFLGDLVAVDPFGELPVGADNISVVAWEWPARHVGSLQGTPATGTELTLRGVTLIDGRASGEDPLFARYIDWLGLYAALGAVTITRPPVDSRIIQTPRNVPHPVDEDESDS